MFLLDNSRCVGIIFQVVTPRAPRVDSGALTLNDGDVWDLSPPCARGYRSQPCGRPSPVCRPTRGKSAGGRPSGVGCRSSAWSSDMKTACAGHPVACISSASSADEKHAGGLSTASCETTGECVPRARRYLSNLLIVSRGTLRRHGVCRWPLLRIIATTRRLRRERQLALNRRCAEGLTATECDRNAAAP